MTKTSQWNGEISYFTCILFAPAEMYLISPINLKWPSHIHTYVLILKLLLHNTWPSQTHAQWLSNFWARTIQKCSMFCVECQSRPRKGSIFIHDAFPHFLGWILIWNVGLQIFMNLFRMFVKCWHPSQSLVIASCIIIDYQASEKYLEETCWVFFLVIGMQKSAGGGGETLNAVPS